MTIIKHELRESGFSFCIWTGIIAFFVGVCVFIFPDMQGEMQDMGAMFSSMGNFSAAFGLDKLDFGTLIGYYAIECGNIVGLGGAFFASTVAVSVLSKEEEKRTAEFLFSHPISRFQVIAEKLISCFVQITAMNLFVYCVVVLSMKIIGEQVPCREINLLHLAYYCLQLELAAICFCVSAFVKKGSIGIGLGIAAISYFLNIVSNLARSTDFLKWLTPFGYCDGGTIIDEGLDFAKIGVGFAFAIVAVVIAFWHYGKKDLS